MTDTSAIAQAASVAPWWASGTFAIGGSLVGLAGSYWLGIHETRRADAHAKQEVLTQLLDFLARAERARKQRDQALRELRNSHFNHQVYTAFGSAGEADAHGRRAQDAEEVSAQTRARTDHLADEWATLRFRASLYLSTPITQAFDAYYQLPENQRHEVAARVSTWGQQEVQATKRGNMAMRRLQKRASRAPLLEPIQEQEQEQKAKD